MKSSTHLSKASAGVTEFFARRNGEAERVAVHARKRRRVYRFAIIRCCGVPRCIVGRPVLSFTCGLPSGNGMASGCSVNCSALNQVCKHCFQSHLYAMSTLQEIKF